MCSASLPALRLSRSLTYRKPPPVLACDLDPITRPFGVTHTHWAGCAQSHIEWSHRYRLPTPR